MKITIKGPPLSIYDGGLFDVGINYPKEYPMQPPKVVFSTPIWNCNISYTDGAVCVETLQKDWTMTTRIDNIIHSLYTLMLCPNPDSAFHSYIGAQFINNKDLYDQTARYWTSVYAGGTDKFPEFENKVSRVMDEGFTEKQSVEKLSIFGWDVEKSIQMLIKELAESFS